VGAVGDDTTAEASIQPKDIESPPTVEEAAETLAEQLEAEKQKKEGQRGRIGTIIGGLGQFGTGGLATRRLMAA
jgi:hypothetical protein